MFEMVKELNRNQKIYKLPLKIKYGFNSGFMGLTQRRTFDIVDAMMWETRKLKPEYSIVEDLTEGFEYVCVSMANTHIEKLVFPAYKVEHKETGEESFAFCMNSIEGKMTMMIYGGDYSTIESDEEYLKRLVELNSKEV